MAGGLARMLGLKACFRECALPITVNGGTVYCAAVRRWPGRQAWLDLLLRGSDLTWMNQHAVMNGIRKGHPCGAAMYTSLTCLGHLLQEGRGSILIAKK